MAENKTPKSEYTQKVEALTKQLQELAESQKEGGNTGIIVISVHAPEDADHEEVVLSMAGRRKPLVRGLCHFAEGTDEDMEDVFLTACKVMAAKHMLRRVHNTMGELLKDGEPVAEEKSETKPEE